MKLTLQNVDRKFSIFSFLIIATFMLMSCLFPYSGDDWAWGSSIGIERLKSLFVDYNGRYVGNLLVLLLTRSKFLDVVFTTVSFYCFCLFPYLFTKERKIEALVFSTFTAYLIPKLIFTQVFVWTSGFANYVPPILLSLGYILLVQNIFTQEKIQYRKSAPFVCFLIAFIGCLFMENVTIYIDILAIGVVIYSYIKFKKFYVTHIAYMAGSFMGTLIMFSNGAYGNVYSGNDSYQTSAVSKGLKETIVTNGEIIYRYIFQKNLPMVTMITILCIALCIVWFRRKNDVSDTKKFVFGALFINVFSLLVAFYKEYYSYWMISYKIFDSDLTVYLLILFGILYFASVFVIIVICATNNCDRDKMIFLLVSSLLIVAPLFLVNPIGPRCFFPSYAVLMMFSTYLFNHVFLKLHFSKDLSNIINISMLAATCASLLFLFSIYIPVYHYSNLRDQYVKDQYNRGYQTIVVCRLPYGSYVWTGDPDPESEIWDYRYKLFNSIDESVDFEMVSPNQFRKWRLEYDKANK